MAHSKHETQQPLRDLVRQGQYEEIKKHLQQKEMKTKFSGETYWFYHSNHEVKYAVRDAILFGKKEIVQLFFDAGASPNDYSYATVDKGFRLPLIHFAVETGDLSMVELIVSNGAAICPENRNGYHGERDNYALKTAVEKGYADHVDYLLQRGAEANDASGGTSSSLHGRITLLAKAAQDGNIRIVESLLRYGASIQNSIGHAHEKLYQHVYMESSSALQRNYGKEERLRIIERAFSFFCKNRSKLYVNYNLMPEAKQKLEELNVVLSDVTNIQQNQEMKDKIVENIFAVHSRKDIAINKSEINQELDKLLKSLQEFDEKKSVIFNKANEAKNSYYQIVKTLMDYAIGCDFDKEYENFSGKYGGLLFLEDLDISNMNFVGVSVDGQPITHEMLAKRKATLEIKGVINNEKAIVSRNELMALTDNNRKNALLKRLDIAFDKQGVFFEKAEGIVNLVPLYQAAKQGNLNAVKIRLYAEVDPNKEKESALVAAAEGGHAEIVKILKESHDKHTAKKTQQLIDNAKQQILTRTDTNGIYVKDGYINILPFSFQSNKYIPVLLNNNCADNYSFLMSMIKNFGLDNLNIAINAVMEKASKEERVILIISRKGSTKYVSYDNPEIVKQFIKEAEGDLPIIFTDINNTDIIAERISSDYKKVDQGKKWTVEAIEAARTNHHTSIVTYLRSLQDINEPDANGDTLLHRAVSEANLERVKELLTKGAKVDQENKNGNTAIDIAVKGNYFGEKNRRLSIIQLLLSQKTLVTPATLNAAIDQDNIEALALLLPQANYLDIFYTKYKNCNEKIQLSKPWFADLIFSALQQKNSIELLKLLQKYGANFNQKNQNGRTLLYEATDQLLSTRVSPEMLENTYNNLANSKNEEISDELKLIYFLLEHGANPSITNDDGETVLHVLIRDKDANVLLLDSLKAKGAPINSFNADQLAPLHVAVHSGDSDATAWLIKHGADLSAQSSSGETPLQIAVRKCFSTIAHLLIEAGADITVLTKDGLSLVQSLDHTYHKKINELKEKCSAAQKELGSGMFSQNSWQKKDKINQYFTAEMANLEKKYNDIKSDLISALKSFQSGHKM